MGLRFLCFLQSKLMGNVISRGLKRSVCILEGKNALKKYPHCGLYYFKVFVNVIHIVMNK